MTKNATVMFDVEETPILKALHVRGRFYYEDLPHANRSLHAINIVVRGGGKYFKAKRACIAYMESTVVLVIVIFSS